MRLASTINKGIFFFVSVSLLVAKTVYSQEFPVQPSANNEINNQVNPNNSGFPSHWKLALIEEPIFQSTLSVAEVGDATLPSVILIHGLGPNGMKDWLSVVPALEANYHVLAVDLPGFAGSINATGRFSPTNYAKVIEYVRAYFLGTKKVAVVGHSMGGAVALRYSANYPNSVERLILVDAAGILERTAFLKQNSSIRVDVPDISPLARATRKLRGIVSGVNDFSGSFIELVNAFPDPTQLIQGDKTWNYVFANRPNLNAGLALIEEDFSTAVNNHTLPTYLIWGSDDGVAPLRTGKALAKQLGNAELNVISGAAHVPMASHPRTFNALLNAKLRQLAPVVITPNLSFNGIEDLVCNNQRGYIYQGSYNTITITHCSGIVLKNITAQRLELINSVVELENVAIYSGRTSVILQDSVLMGTAIDISGATAFKIDGSRVDLAAATIVGTEEAFRIKNSSKLLFSISKVSSPVFSGDLHGSYSAEDSIFDWALH